jgi:hypothetical protein
VSGDLTGGGSTSTEKSPDVETWVGQLAGDVDVAQLNHHGSTSASTQKFLNALQAEVAIAETGSTNTFGHPNRETVNKFLNTPTTSGNSFTGTAQPPPGTGPVFYQIEQSSSSDDRDGRKRHDPAHHGRHDRLLAAKLRRRRRAHQPGAAHLSDRRRVERHHHRFSAHRYPDDESGGAARDGRGRGVCAGERS